MSEKVEQTFNKGESCPQLQRSSKLQASLPACAKWKLPQASQPPALATSMAPAEALLPLPAGNLRLLGTAVGGVFGYVVMLR